MLLRSNGEGREDNNTKLMRDKAYTNLKILVAYIGCYGKHVFCNAPEKAAAYASQYH